MRNKSRKRPRNLICLLLDCDISPLFQLIYVSVISSGSITALRNVFSFTRTAFNQILLCVSSGWSADVSKIFQISKMAPKWHRGTSNMCVFFDSSFHFRALDFTAAGSFSHPPLYMQTITLDEQNVSTLYDMRCCFCVCLCKKPSAPVFSLHFSFILPLFAATVLKDKERDIRWLRM